MQVFAVNDLFNTMENHGFAFKYAYNKDMGGSIHTLFIRTFGSIKKQKRKKKTLHLNK